MDFFAEEIQIVRGSKKDINIFMLYKNSGRPYPLNGIVEIKVAFTKDTGVLTKKLSVADVSVVGVADLGQILCTLQGSETALLKLCKKGKDNGLSFTVQLDFGGGRVENYNFENLVFVEDPKVVPA